MSSGASLDVVLWGERATSFLAEQLHKDGQHSPQIVIFVGTLVRAMLVCISNNCIVASVVPLCLKPFLAVLGTISLSGRLIMQVVYKS
jgi:replication factor A1